MAYFIAQTACPVPMSSHVTLNPSKGNIIGQGRLITIPKKVINMCFTSNVSSKCAICKRLLTVSNFVMAERKVYCKPHAKTVAVSS